MRNEEERKARASGERKDCNVYFQWDPEPKPEPESKLTPASEREYRVGCYII